MISWYILLKNVGEWHTNVESRDMFSSDEADPSDFKEGPKDHDDEYEEVSPKQISLKETPENISLVETETAKENGHNHHAIKGDAMNGNGVHEIHLEDPHNYDDRDDEGNIKDDIDDGQVNGEENHNDKAAAETNDGDLVSPVPYYGRTLVAPEYMNFQLEETSQKEEKTQEDDNDNRITVTDESSDDLGSPRAEEETHDQTFQKEVLEEDDITLSEEESEEDEGEDEDEVGNVEEEDQSVRVDCQAEEQNEEEEHEEEEEDEEHEGKEEENTACENAEVYRVGSPQLAQAEDCEEEDEEGNEYDEVQEGGSLKGGEVEEQETTEADDGQPATQSQSSLQLAETDDDDEHDEEIEIVTTNESNPKNSDSLKVQVASPALDIGEVGFVAVSFDDRDGKGVTIEDNGGDKLSDREAQEFTIEDRSFSETDDQREERRTTVRIY